MKEEIDTLEQHVAEHIKNHLTLLMQHIEKSLPEAITAKCNFSLVGDNGIKIEFKLDDAKTLTEVVFECLNEDKYLYATVLNSTKTIGIRELFLHLTSNSIKEITRVSGLEQLLKN